MSARLIQVPYDSGLREQRMGRGPTCFVDNGAIERLTETAGPVEASVVEPGDGYPMEIALSFELYRSVAEQVSSAHAAGQFPLVLAGNCHTMVGVLAGHGERNVALIWFDAHGDINTPETTTSGFLDGMPVAMITGRCWRAMTRTIPGFRPLPDDRVALVGVRDFDETEAVVFRESAIHMVRCEEIHDSGADSALDSILESWSGQIDGVHVHIDLDVHDPIHCRANSYQPGGGLSPDEVQACVRAIAGKLPLLGATLTAYDPEADRERRGLAVGLDLIAMLGALGRGE